MIWREREFTNIRFHRLSLSVLACIPSILAGAAILGKTAVVLLRHADVQKALVDAVMNDRSMAILIFSKGILG